MKALKVDDRALHQPEGTDFNPKQGFLLVRLDKEQYGLPDEPVRYQGQVYQPKSELHITIISQGAAEQLQQALAGNPEMEKRVQQLIGQTDWSYRKENAFYHVVESPEVESIIQKVSVPHVEEFYEQLNDTIGSSLEPPPTHITLYTRGDSQGIGLSTQATFERLVKGMVSPDEVLPEKGD